MYSGKLNLHTIKRYSTIIKLHESNESFAFARSYTYDLGKYSEMPVPIFMLDEASFSIIKNIDIIRLGVIYYFNINTNIQDSLLTLTVMITMIMTVLDLIWLVYILKFNNYCSVMHKILTLTFTGRLVISFILIVNLIFMEWPFSQDEIMTGLL